MPLHTLIAAASLIASMLAPAVAHAHEHEHEHEHDLAPGERQRVAP